MAFNLIRNSRVFWTSNVNTTTGAVKADGFLPSNTREIQVLEGFSFSQNTTSETVTLNEAGATPVRGQRSFNTALDPADFSFTTYMRPQDAGTNITAEEAVLWNAMFSNSDYSATAPVAVNSGSFVVGTKYTITALSDGLGGSTTSFTSLGASANTVGVVFTATGVGSGTGTATPVPTRAWTDGTTSAVCTVTNSDKHQLLPFGLIIIVDDTTFIIDNCVLNTATIDFGLDAIASVQWAGQGGSLRQITSPTVAANTNLTIGGALSGTLSGTFLQKVTSCPYIANKLSVVTLDEEIGSGGTAYNVALTGGSLTISNNVTYLTPANLATVNKPVTYFTSTRAISGSLNAYLRTGTGNTSALMQSMLNNSATAVNPATNTAFVIGIPATAPAPTLFVGASSFKNFASNSSSMLIFCLTLSFNLV